MGNLMRMAEGGGGGEKFFSFGLVGDLFDCDMKMCF